MTKPVMVRSVALANSTQGEPESSVLVQDWPPAGLETSGKLQFSVIPILPLKARDLNHIISEVLSTTQKKFDESKHSWNPIPWLKAAHCSLKEPPLSDLTLPQLESGAPASLPNIVAGTPHMCRAPT